MMFDEASIHSFLVYPLTCTIWFVSKYQATRKQGDVEISNFPISLRDGLVIDVSFVCEFTGSSRAPGGWNNGVRHSNDVLQARANVKNNKYKDVYGLVQGVCTCHCRYVRSDPR